MAAAGIGMGSSKGTGSVSGLGTYTAMGDAAAVDAGSTDAIGFAAPPETRAGGRGIAGAAPPVPPDAFGALNAGRAGSLPPDAPTAGICRHAASGLGRELRMRRAHLRLHGAQRCARSSSSWRNQAKRAACCSCSQGLGRRRLILDVFAIHLAHEHK